MGFIYFSILMPVVSGGVYGMNIVLPVLIIIAANILIGVFSFNLKMFLAKFQSLEHVVIHEIDEESATLKADKMLRI